MSNDQAETGGGTCLELSCSGEQLETAKLTFTRNGTLYRVTCGPLSGEQFVQLERAAKTGELLRLVFPRSVVTLSRITVEWPKPGWAQIEGLALHSRPTRPDGSHDVDDARLRSMPHGERPERTLQRPE